jgi:hypothetical protein
MKSTTTSPTGYTATEPPTVPAGAIAIDGKVLNANAESEMFCQPITAEAHGDISDAISRTTFSTPLQPANPEECDAFDVFDELDRDRQELLWIVLFALALTVAIVMCFVLSAGGAR